jgi:hypothetical protein
MIGLYEYNLLSTDEKAQTLWDLGEFIVSRKSKTNSANLYSISDFFVEVNYDNDKNEIVDLRSFKSNKLLEPYLDYIDLEKLLE